MIEFRYAARTAGGERVRGSITARDRDDAIAGLNARALFLTAVAPATRWNAPLRIGRFGAGDRARVAFFRAFATLVRAGVPLRRALAVTAERTTDETLRIALHDVRAAVERGEALSAALAGRPRVFPPLIVAMIAAGETGGMLDDVLARVATSLERGDAVRAKVTAALAYPATVAVAALALVAFIIVRIVPMFADLFAAFHVDLPASTRALLWLGTTFASPLAWLAPVALAAGAAFALRSVARTARGSRALDRARLAVPLIGRLLRAAVHARLARTLGTLVCAGVDLTRALEVAAPVTGSPVVAEALAGVALAIRAGEGLAPPLEAAGCFDPLFVSLVAVGEETGMLDELLERAAAYFETDVEAAVAALSAIVEPVLVVVLGAVVGLIVSSVYLPLYQLIGSLGQ